MARFLIATMPITGHVNPGLPIARTLVERGHEVCWYTGQKFRTAVQATGARYAPMQAAYDFDDRDMSAAFPSKVEPSNFLEQANWGLKRLFIDPVPGQVADLQRILHEFRADVLINETMFFGAEAVHNLGGPPWATFAISTLTINSRDAAPVTTGLPPSSSIAGRLRNHLLNVLIKQVLLRESNHHMNYLRWTLGLPPLKHHLVDTLSPFLYMHSSTPAFEYPRSDLPPQVHFIGPLLPQPPMNFVQPAWWNDLQGSRPVVFVTQGTIATAAHDLIIPVLRALVDQDVLVVAATGGKTAAQLGLNVPANARVEPFIPYGALLPHVDVMITNGGFGGVQFALAHGVPLIVAGTTEDKRDVNARVAWSGAGINLKTKNPAPEQIRAAVDAILHNPRYRQNARRIRHDYAQHDAPHEAAALLEQLAVTKQAVLRSEPLRHLQPQLINT